LAGPEVTYASGCGTPRPPGTDARCGAAAVLTAATAGLSMVREPRLVRERFEEEVRALLSARSVVLRDDGCEPALAHPNTISLDLPTASPDRRACIEAVFDATRRMDGWTQRVMEAGAHVAALLLELERAQGRSVVRRRRDGAAPLIGSSVEIQRVRDRIERVAATDFTVLIEGESGTGKEVVARFIRHASNRAHGPFVALNCAALPEQLLESELFGYERGAFTGAQQAKPGQIELAAGGVLFLDEVAEMSASAQAKFLRVLQEREFQRLGSTRTLKANVRVIAATNRDLKKALERGDFREDLFYRLQVFDIKLPPLRARPTDILPVPTNNPILQESGWRGASGRRLPVA
jgi:transcriptional regulator with PAS, ATPase and Fis domain